MLGRVGGFIDPTLQVMTDLFRDLNRLCNEGCDDIAVLQPYFDQAAAYTTWYQKRKRVANSMKAAAGTKK